MSVETATETFLGLEAVIVSPVMRNLMAQLQRVAQTEACVLITGESGSGKELAARAIHQYSLRSAKPWVDVNCGALPEHLMESELFGYEKGAFSGADTGKPGLFEMADTGTLFLDEIGELDPKMQVKLLRVLDRAPYYRLGGKKKITVDVRVLAATNQDLKAAIREGRFRSDLYHRLSQVKVPVPPLRERPEDIPALARFFLDQQNTAIELSQGALARMQRHAWPGNVRELRNVLISSSIAALSDRIEENDLVLEGEEKPAASLSADTVNLEELERQTILRVLRETGSHHEKAAVLLGISTRTLSRKLKAYGMGRVNEDCLTGSVDE
ncbi:MAG: sigma-54-dependent Fis family transcriptional regulator [Acidimicrobiia bacterium]|nr:sigma-54-dependent Fis family transcriptional regulator [Acidimicrobiia bacterium]